MRITLILIPIQKDNAEGQNRRTRMNKQKRLLALWPHCQQRRIVTNKGMISAESIRNHILNSHGRMMQNDAEVAASESGRCHCNHLQSNTRPSKSILGPTSERSAVRCDMPGAACRAADWTGAQGSSCEAPFGVCTGESDCEAQNGKAVQKLAGQKL